MFAAGINIKVPDNGPSQTIFWKHAPYRFFDDGFRFLCQHLLGAGKTLTAGIAGMPYIFLLIPFCSAELNFFSVDDDYMITTIGMRGEVDLVFPPNDFCNLGGQSAKYLVFCINKNPFLFGGLLVGRYGFVA